MKSRLLLPIIFGLFLFLSCGEDGSEDIVPVSSEVAKDSLTTIEAEFIYLSEAAVLKGRSFIYGVEMDSLAMELVQRTEPLKRDEFDMIPVVVRAKIIDNPNKQGWDEIAQIREILKIPERHPDTVNSSDLNK